MTNTELLDAIREVCERDQVSLIITRIGWDFVDSHSVEIVPDPNMCELLERIKES